jgi:hypothetical protein
MASFLKKHSKKLIYSISISLASILVFFGFNIGGTGKSTLFSQNAFSQKVFAGHVSNCWCGGGGAFFAQIVYGDDGDDSGNDSGSSGCICGDFFDGGDDDDGGCP